MPVCVSARECRCLRSPGEVSEFLGAADCCELPDRGAGSKGAGSQTAATIRVLLAAESSLQPHID